MAVLTVSGCLIKDTFLAATAQGTSVASIVLPIRYGVKGADGLRPTQWVEGVLLGRKAEALAKYLTKGKFVEVGIEDPHVETFSRRDGSQGHKLTGRIVALTFLSKDPEEAK